MADGTIVAGGGDGTLLFSSDDGRTFDALPALPHGAEEGRGGLSLLCPHAGTMLATGPEHPLLCIEPKRSA